MIRITTILFLLLNSFNNLFAQQIVTLKGTITDSVTNQYLPNANVMVFPIQKGIITDASGKFAIELPIGNYQLKAAFLGYQTKSITLELKKEDALNIQLLPISIEVGGATITSRRPDENVTSVQAGTLHLDSKEVNKLPSLLGEPDIINAIRLTPGVQSNGEGNPGLFVRGGDAGQNLFLLDNMPLYNPSHLLGFFPLFNFDILGPAKLIKGGIPANYGGRTSSVIDLSMKEGNREKVEGSGSFGLLSADLTIGGPLSNGKGSLIVSFRRTYLDLVRAMSKAIIPESKNFFNQTDYYFYDASLKFTHQLGSKTRIIISAFGSKDTYSLIDQAFSISNSMNWTNIAGNISLKHNFSENLLASYSAGFTTYDFKIAAAFYNNYFNLSSGVKDWYQNLDFLHRFTENSRIKYGLNYTHHILTPNKVDIAVEKVNYFNNNQYFSNEGSAYLQGDFSLNQKFSFSTGLRQTYFQHVGPYTHYNRNSEGQIYDSTVFAKNENVKGYLTFDPNLSWVYLFNNQSSIKGTFSLTHQFIHLASVASVSLPTDVWLPSTSFIPPQKVGLVTLGYFRNFFDNSFETSVEGFYKNLGNQIDFLNGVLDNFDNTKIEQNIIIGKGQAFGAEFYIKKRSGQATGSISYTLSRTLKQFDEISDKPFPAKYDRIHDLAATFSYELNKRWNFSAVFVYATGNAMTLPAGRYVIQGNVANDYTAVNSFRMPAYHRLDVSATYQLKKRSIWDSWLVFSIYNVYNHSNPYFIYFQVKGDIDHYYLSVTPKQITLFPILPSITWNVKF